MKRITNGKEIADIIEPSETYLVIATMITKITKEIKRSNGAIPNNIPADVLTPLPPLNPAKIVHICPITAKHPAIICSVVKLRIKASL